MNHPRLLPLLLGITLTGCLEISIRTTVNEDGSADRTIALSDERELPVTAFPIPRDSTWTTSWGVSEENPKRHEYIARKHFPRPEDLQAEYETLPDTSLFSVRVLVRKRFEWFYTYFDYAEAYTIRNPFNRIPITDLMSPESVERYMQGEGSDSLKKIVGRWQGRCMAEELFVDLIDAAKRRGDAETAEIIRRERENLFEAISEEPEPDDAADLVARLGKALGGRDMRSFAGDIDSSWQRIEREQLRLQSTNGVYRIAVALPGVLLSSNSRTVEGSSASWEVDAERLLVKPFVVEASSRVTNVWAIAGTGIAGAVILGSFALQGYRRRRRSRSRENAS